MKVYYDYWIKLPETPAFEENIANMYLQIEDDKGTYPSKISAGTKPNNGSTLLHFRLPARMTESELLAYLRDPMVNPKPPISVMLIRSAEKDIYVYDGDAGYPLAHYEYETLLQANKATFMPFMNDITDNTDPENPVTRPPNNSDALFLSGYYGSEPVELV